GRNCSFLQLLGEPARLRRVDMDAGAHRARERDLPDVAALRRRRLRPDDLVQHCCVVLDERPLVEALLPDRDVDVRAAVGPVLELAGLRLAHRLAHLEGDRARLRVRHEAARAEDPAEPADVPHLVGSRDRDVEVGEALLDLLGEVDGADDVRPGLFRLTGLVALGEDGHANVLARAVREHEGAAELLVGMADVQAEPEMHLDRLVELRRGGLLQLPDRLGRRVGALAVDLPARLDVALAARAHRSTSTPIERAVPAMISAAWSMSRAFRSGSFVSAIWRTCARVSRPTLSRFG